jgi:hypothetical protein
MPWNTLRNLLPIPMQEAEISLISAQTATLKPVDCFIKFP